MEPVFFRDRFCSRSEALISPFLSGVRYGLNLFETLLTRGSTPLFFGEHMARLRLSAEALELPLPLSAQDMARTTAALLERTGPPAHGRLRWTVFSGAQEPGGDYAAPAKDGILLMEIAETTLATEEAWHKGWSVITIPPKMGRSGSFAGHKTGNYVPSLLARRTASRAGVPEALFLSHEEEPLEGSATNLFARVGGRILTPPLDSDILPGTVRSILLRAGKFAGLPVEEKRFTFEDLTASSDAFLTNALIGVMPLTEVDGGTLGSGAPGPATLAARAYLSEAEDADAGQWQERFSEGSGKQG